MASYPTTVKTWAPKIDNVDDVMAADINTAYNEITATQTELDIVKLAIAAAGSGSPSGVYATLAALDAAIPAGDSNIYVTLNDGHWAYWTGAAWADGGAYTATAASQIPITDAGGYLTTAPKTAETMSQDYGAALAQVAKISLSNLITHGNFDATTDWVGGYANLTAASNVLSVTGTGASGSVYVQQTITGQATPYKKLYLGAMVRVTDAVCTSIKVSAQHTGGTTQYWLDQATPVENEWYPISAFVLTPADFDSGDLVLRLRAYYTSAGAANGKVMEVKYVLMQDSTTTFGTGNEPSVNVIENLLADYTNSWFGGTEQITYYRYWKAMHEEISATQNNIDGTNQSANLFNICTILEGYTDSVNGLAAVSGWNCSAYIPVKPSTEYIFSTTEITFGARYDANKRLLGTLTVSDAQHTDYAVTMDSVTYYIRINIRDAKLTNYMMVEGSTMPVSFVAYDGTIEWLSLYPKTVTYESLDNDLRAIYALAASQWADKNGVTFGDSITYYDGIVYAATHVESGTECIGYQSYMRSEMGCIVDNQGYSGATTRQIYETKIFGYDFSDTDFVVLTSGANDHRKAVALGAVGAVGAVFDLATFAGAFQTAIEYILTQKPAVQIYLITPIKGWFHESATEEVPGPYNSEMIISLDYVNIIKALGNLYSLPVLDWYNISGINELTKDSVPLIGDDDTVFTAYDLHPTQAGYSRMANSLIPFLNNN